jgi:hypothetical protein
LNRNGRSYLLDLIRPQSATDTNKKTVGNGLDGYYLADKLSVRNKYKKFGRRNDDYEEFRNEIFSKFLLDQLARESNDYENDKK